MKTIPEGKKVELIKAAHAAMEMRDHLHAAYWIEANGSAQFLLDRAHEDLVRLAAQMGYALVPLDAAPVEGELEAETERDYLVPEDVA